MVIHIIFLMDTNPYIADILAQPEALRAALQHYPHSQLDALRSRLAAGEFHRIVLTGMGSSYNAAYPALLALARLPVSVALVNTAELIHYSAGQIDDRTLLWINSQSGRSAEIVRALDQMTNARPPCVLGMTNYLDSPLGRQAGVAVPIWAGDEATVSTKTYLNMLSVLLLAATQLAGGDWRSLRGAMQHAASAIESFLANLDQLVESLDALLGSVENLFIVGRGPSMAAVWNGSLINKEAARCAFEGMNAADFRHGPLELAGPGLTLLLLEGDPATAGLNRALGVEVQALGGKVIWLGMREEPGLPAFLLPRVDERARPLVEILPLQLLTLVMARRKGLVAGKFRHVDKITTQE